MAVLVIAEHDNAALKPATLNTVTAAAGLSDVTVLVAGNRCRPVAEAAAAIDGVIKVLLADDGALEHPLPEILAPFVQGLVQDKAGDYSHVFAPATTFGKNLMPRVAALLDVQQISEITAIDDADTFVRPIYAGNAMATVKSGDAVKVITVRITAFEPAAAEGGSAMIEDVGGDKDFGEASPLSSFVSQELTKSERPELTSAKVIVSGGRALKDGETFEQLIFPLADKLGAAAKTAGEAMWHMPLVESLREMLKSDWADLKHMGDRWGGSITAALFLREFVGDTPWVHVDIAGPSMASKNYDIYTKGGTGHGVLTFLALIDDLIAAEA